MPRTADREPAIPDDTAPVPPAHRPTWWTVRTVRWIGSLLTGLAVLVAFGAIWLSYDTTVAATRLAQQADELVGYVGVAAHGPDADVQTLAVAPARRGSGLGRRLVALAVEAARAAGARRLGLEVREDNAAALALYGAAGFVRQGRRPGYYAPVDGRGPRVAALLMQVAL